MVACAAPVDVPPRSPEVETDNAIFVPPFVGSDVVKGIPIGRAGHVDDVASLCLYLASDASKYMTGAIIPIDGGWTAS